MIFAFSAAFLGFIHSLSPGHWLPILLVARGRKWNRNQALVGAFVVGMGHTLISVIVGGVSLWIGSKYLHGHLEKIEDSAGTMMIVVGVIYAGLSFFRHGHHGPSPKPRQSAHPYIFLLTLGLSPCLAVLPIFVGAAATGGFVETAFSMVAFSIGVLTALLGSTFLAMIGVSRLDHPLLEHSGEVIAGIGIAVVGVWVSFFHT